MQFPATGGRVASVAMGLMLPLAHGIVTTSSEPAPGRGGPLSRLPRGPGRPVPRAGEPDGDGVSWSIERRDPDGVIHVVRVHAPVDIGREVDGIVVDDQLVSRRHARLDLVGSSLVLTDLGSTNGSWVNDRRVESIALGEGDHIRIGTTVLIVETVEAMPRGRPAAADEGARDEAEAG